jgi:phospholipid/cholesterol/gamma-HCH transport system substrate-binding protein
MALPVPNTSPRGGNLFETILSALVILVAIGFMVFFFNQVSTGHLGSYGLKVSMADASGLSEGSEVRLAGVKVGTVTGLTLEPTSYRAVVEISVRDDLSLPVDSRAAVSSSALGGLYLALVPGHSAAIIAEGDTIGLPIGRAPARHSGPPNRP